MSSATDFLFGSPGRIQQQSTLMPEQKGLYQQMINSAMGRGGGGAFGQAGDYYRNLLSNRGGDFEAFAAPEMRQFQEDIVPGLAEQFAGFGHGGLSGSGFRNAAMRAGTDLSERLGALRAQLRQSAASGLMGLGQQGLGQYGENIYMQPTTGFIPALSMAGANAVGTGLGMYAGKMF